MGICRAQWLLWGVVGLLALLNLLSACGSKGDLYLPPPPVQLTPQPAAVGTANGADEIPPAPGSGPAEQEADAAGPTPRGSTPDSSTP